MRREFRRRAEMPFADPTGDITRRLQPRRQQRLTHRQSLAMIRRIVEGISLVAEALLVAAGHEPGARGAAERMGHIPIRETRPGYRQPIEMRRRDVLGALEPS